MAKAKSKKVAKVASRAPLYRDEQKIKLLVKANPKSGDSAKRFAKYKNGMTIAAALKAGVWRGDLRWDVGHGFIAVV